MEDSFGHYLKHQRELRGISLDDIANATRIPARHLEALEEDRFDDLPAEVFIKGYIRSYGEALGVDANELLTAYEERIGKGRREVREKSLKEAVQREHKKSFWQTQMKLVGFIVGLGLVGWLVWAILQSQPSTGPQEANAPVSGVTEKEVSSGTTGTQPVMGSGPQPGPPPEGGEAPPPPGSGMESSGAQPPSPTESPEGLDIVPGENKISQSENGGIINDLQDQIVPTNRSVLETPGSKQTGGFSLEIRASEKAWFHMIVDRETEKDFTLQPGERIVLRADEQILADIGNRNGSEFWLNGKKLELPGTRNVILDFVFKAELVE
ncbi:helix-turn-helix domain-containing protein [Nitrospina gracilis]|uniref:helix-turn-helix domain-containing protein n=1 Tax=Nitrospina gracilis TaxID=35801 RepID=UPI001F22575D|nr:RodZ domain-containing protein [Nitrospina gracilis]MCF8721943.1 cytoskeletal protein RodZ [Nitrospina gracilis Nb-211]